MGRKPLRLLPTFFKFLYNILCYVSFIKIQYMHQLKRIKSQQLIDKLFNNRDRYNHYDHHNMPARSTHRNFLRTSPVKKNSIQVKSDRTIIGRQLYPTIIKKIQDPGPGTYDFFVKQPKSFKFVTTHTGNSKRKIIPIRTREYKLGPGIYKHENAASLNLLSQFKKPATTKIVQNGKNEERLVFKRSEVPGPGNYENNYNLQKTSNFSVSNTYKISVTARSSMIRSDKLPGPGQYDWDKFYEKAKEKKKPVIEYKFVYGHPS